MKVIKPNTFSAVDGSFTRASTATYFDAQKALQVAAIDEPRFNYNPLTSEFEGIVIEGESTNLVLNSATLVDQSITVVDTTVYTFSFYGSGSVTLSDAHSVVLNGVDDFPPTRVSVTFTAASTNLDLVVSGTVEMAQLEEGVVATSYIPTTASPETRAADIVTGSGLIWTDVVNPDPEYDAGTTYSLGDKVSYLNNVWESLQNSNTGNTPDLNPTFWLDLGIDNQHAAFDNQVSTVSTATTSMTFVVKVGIIDTMAFIDVDGATLRVAVTDPSEGTVYSNIYGVAGGNIYDWYQYFFNDPLVIRRQIVFYDIPPYSSGLVTVRLENSTGLDVELAQAVFGMLSELGGTQYGATSGIIDYSIKETDDFGVVTFVERNFSKRLSAQVFLRNSQINRVHNFLTAIRATPSVWIASDDPKFEEPLIVFGFYKDFSMDIAYPSHSLCSIEIEGLA